jgi:hypothetical protein
LVTPGTAELGPVGGEVVVVLPPVGRLFGLMFGESARAVLILIARVSAHTITVVVRIDGWAATVLIAASAYKTIATRAKATHKPGFGRPPIEISASVLANTRNVAGFTQDDLRNVAHSPVREESRWLR